MNTSRIADPSRQDITTRLLGYVVFIRKPLHGYITALKLHFLFIAAPLDIQVFLSSCVGVRELASMQRSDRGIECFYKCSGVIYELLQIFLNVGVMDNNFQRKGAISNTHIGHNFELDAKIFFEKIGIPLHKNHKVMVGVSDLKKAHRFDLGCSDLKILVECKSHRWTTGNNVPSAKLTVWNEAMFYFSSAPHDYRKIMFVLKDERYNSRVTLAQYYINRYQHLIPVGVEFWEYDELTMEAVQIY